MVDNSMTDQEIFKKIGQLLWSIMPTDIKEIIFCGKDYNSYSQQKFILKTHNGLLRSFTKNDSHTDDIGDEILGLVIKLKDIPPYLSNPWTHFKVSLTEKGEFSIKFKYISKEQDSMGIYMRTANESPLEDELS